MDVRRLALAKAGLLKPEWVGLPGRASGRSEKSRDAALAVIRHFGYLQLDTIAVAGARTHGIVLASRLDGFEAGLAEELLRPGAPLFEYWGHEASWLPLELYPALGWRRERSRDEKQVKGILEAHRGLADQVLRQVRDEGPVRSSELGGEGDQVIYGQKASRYVAMALWSCGDLAVHERRGFQRVYDLPERVIPARFRNRDLCFKDAAQQLLRFALGGHGFATAKTLADTFRLRVSRKETKAAIESLVEDGTAVPCRLETRDGKDQSGYICPADLELAARLRRVRPRPDRGVLLSPFDPVLWDRKRVKLLFGFEQVLEIYKPAAKRVYGYYVLPVLAGERLVGRVDLKADRKTGTLRLLSLQYESAKPSSADRAAVRTGLDRHAGAVQLKAPASPSRGGTSSSTSAPD